MKFIVERIEEKKVVLEKEDKTHLTILKEEMNLVVHEGDVVIFENGIYAIDKQETEKLRKEVINRTKRLFGK